MSAADQAGLIASKGFGMLWSATVAGIDGISKGLTTAKKQVSDYYEKDQLDSLRRTGKTPTELLYYVMQRFCYLSLAGYNNEAAAAARKAGTKLTESDSAVPLDVVLAAGRGLTDASRAYGDFSQGSWLGLSDFLNTSKMGKDHFDRDALVNDLYYALFLLAERSGGVNEAFEKGLRDAATRLMEGGSSLSDTHASNSYGDPSSTPSLASTSASPASVPGPYNLNSLSGSLPSYAQPASAPPGYDRNAKAFGSNTAAPKGISPASFFGGGSGGGAGKVDDAKTRVAKVVFVIGSSIRKAGEESDARRLKTLKEAEDMLRKDRDAAQLANPSLSSAPSYATPSLSAFGSSYKPTNTPLALTAPPSSARGGATPISGSAYSAYPSSYSAQPLSGASPYSGSGYGSMGATPISQYSTARSDYPATAALAGYSGNSLDSLTVTGAGGGYGGGGYGGGGTLQPALPSNSKSNSSTSSSYNLLL